MRFWLVYGVFGLGYKVLDLEYSVFSFGPRVRGFGARVRGLGLGYKVLELGSAPGTNSRTLVHSKPKSSNLGALQAQIRHRQPQREALQN